MARDGRWCPWSRGVGIAVGAFAVAVIAIAPALACVPTANIELNPSRGEPGSVITVSGSVFEPGGTPVEIRWGGARGDILGRAGANDAGQFSVTVNVPSAAPGHYIVSAIQRLNDGSYKRSAASFEVPGKTPATQTSAQPSGDQAVPEQKDQQPAPARMAAPADPSPTPVASPAERSTAPAPQPARPGSGAISPARAARAEVHPGGSNAESPAAPAPAPDSHTAITEPLESSVPPMSAVGDLWSGFGAEGSPGLATGPAERPSVAADEDHRTLLVGAGLMASAILMMLGAAVPAISRRRRSSVEVANHER